MKKHTFWYLFACLLLISCTDQSAHKTDIVAEVNDFRLSQDEFERQLAAELEFDDDFKVTMDAKKKFLNDLIEKEILIQEAKKLKLDRKEKFIRAIERYWESTLIRDLLELKGADIDKTTIISEEEISAYYNERKKADPSLPPPAQIRDTLQDDLKEKKKRQKLQQWISGIREKAKIKIHEDML